MALLFSARFSLRDSLIFFANRYVRIASAYLISIVLCAVLFVGLFCIPETARAARTAEGFHYFQNLGSLLAAVNLSALTLFGQDIVSVFDNCILPNRVGWSLSAELIFYALTPLLVQLRIRHLAAFTVCTFALKYWIATRYGWMAAYFSFYGQIGFFAFRIALFKIRSGLPSSAERFHAVAIAMSATLTFILRAPLFEG